MALAITSENLKTLMDSGKPLVVDFWAEWCGPCRTIAPIIDELAAEYEGRVAIGKCDVDDNNAVATQFSVRNIPTILFIKGGQVVDKQVGACPKSVLEEKITKLPVFGKGGADAPSVFRSNVRMATSCPDISRLERTCPFERFRRARRPESARLFPFAQGVR